MLLSLKAQLVAALVWGKQAKTSARAKASLLEGLVISMEEAPNMTMLRVTAKTEISLSKAPPW